MGHTTLNHMTDGGDTLVIGGTLEVLDTATVNGLGDIKASAATASTLGGVKAASAGAGDTVEIKINSTSKKLFAPAYPQAELVAEAAGAEVTAAEFKALLDALKAAGLMATS